MAKKNITITLSEETEGELLELVEFFQQSSVATVNKSDVMKFLIGQANKEIVKKGKSFNQIFKFDE